jgi:hypothetical protein
MTHEEQIKWMTDRIAHLETQHKSAMDMVATLMGKLDTLVKAEREACAKVCDAFQARDVGMQPAECAGAIRARGLA